jgi:hypothetical protein
MEALGSRQRSEPRHVLFFPVEVTLRFGKDEKISKGIIINCSESGLCVCSYAFPSEGQEISVQSPQHIPERRYVVRWVNKQSDIFFMAGMSSSR